MSLRPRLAAASMRLLLLPISQGVGWNLSVVNYRSNWVRFVVSTPSLGFIGPDYNICALGYGEKGAILVFILYETLLKLTLNQCTD